MTHFSDADKAQMAAKGISEQRVEAQLERFRTGFPYLHIVAPATAGQGIMVADDELTAACEARWARYLADGGTVLKFVPASGAASRMFKALFAFVDGKDATPAEGSPVADLLANIRKFAFYADLNAALRRIHGKGVEELLADGKAKEVVAGIILPEGLNYGALPKALLKFHRYAAGKVRTALEEQLVEAAEMSEGAPDVNVHFTVSSNHHTLFDKALANAIPVIEKETGRHFHVSLSEQKPSTDTIAAAPDGEPFRDEEGKLVFRPGGHGALIENLDDIDSEVVFIKNIDNIAAAELRGRSVPYKKLLGGMLMLVADRIESFIAAIKEGADGAVLDEAERFCRMMLTLDGDALGSDLPAAERARALLAILDRPLRVCGMVRNEGEPGGGPYLAYSSDGSMVAPQILESSQIDLSKPENKAMMASASHFNPVDLACRLRRADGTSYDLADYVDPSTGFISEKSLNGRDLRALELPGLWNGAMSDWNTVFMEVPAYTFTPAKTVNDLLRPAHQADNK
ncbi:MAG: DUF4301 family protein [Muribaculaceae bacterium]|nr:DUF4301 family protein [Muribaculaceae bacterium]